MGVVFFATPHRGGNGVSLGDVITNAVLRLSGKSASKSDILDNLKPISAHSEALIRNFRPMLEKYQFISFFETKPTRTMKQGIAKFTKFLFPAKVKRLRIAAFLL